MTVIAIVVIVAVAAIDARGGRQAAEEAVLFAVDAGGEEEGVVAAGRAVVAEGECPEAFDLDRVGVLVAKEAVEFAAPGIEGGDAAGAEVADKDVAAEIAEVVGGLCH